MFALQVRPTRLFQYLGLVSPIGRFDWWGRIWTSLAARLRQVLFGVRDWSGAFRFLLPDHYEDIYGEGVDPLATWLPGHA